MISLYLQIPENFITIIIMILLQKSFILYQRLLMDFHSRLSIKSPQVSRRCEFLISALDGGLLLWS